MNQNPVALLNVKIICKWMLVLPERKKCCDKPNIIHPTPRFTRNGLVLTTKYVDFTLWFTSLTTFTSATMDR